jgi:glycosyltransferase involved in cell wall biosynthesis
VNAATTGRRVALVLSAGGWRGSHISYSGIGRGLGHRGHAVVLFTGAPEPKARFLELGIPTVQLDLSTTGWRQSRALRAALLEHGTEIVITDNPRDLRLTALAVLGTGIRLVHRFNLGRYRPPRDVGTRLAFRRASGTIFLTESESRRILEAAPYFSRRPHWIIGSPIDLDIYHADAEAASRFRQKHGLGAGAFLLAAAALRQEKRYDVLVDAVALLGADAPPVVVCGEGPMREAIATRAASRGVSVRFAGLVPPEEMRGAFSAATVVAHASPVETFGRIVAEAMACGAAVVAVGAGSLNDVVGDAGLLVPADDVEAFAGALGRLLANPGLRSELGAAARARSRSRYSLASTLDAYDALLSDPLLQAPPK